MDEKRDELESCCGPRRSEPAKQPCCCRPVPGAERRAESPAAKPPRFEAHWIDGTVETAAGEIPRVRTALQFPDRIGAWRMRWGMGRMRYKVPPGLYAVGRPDRESPVLVSANYKLSFDRLRSRLGGLDAWILVIDTRGINVWCAAGKGTFGTDEILKCLEAAQVGRVVSHRTLILPQLSAPGVSAHEVRKRSGFRVVYGPVRADDLPGFLAAGLKATPEMRRVRFPFVDRVRLIPVELVGWAKYMVPAAVVFLLLAGLGMGGYSFSRLSGVGLRSALLLLGAYFASVILTPALLPWLPARAFSAKGAWVGVIYMGAVALFAMFRPGLFESSLETAAWILMGLAVSSFVAMNFTGCSTYTSLSGVRREMRIAVPVQIVCAVVGFGLWLAGRFIT
jgi:hypothetical protein